MGLGKTIQLISLCIANPLKNTLLVVPASLIGQWCTELNKIAPDIGIFCHHGKSRIIYSDQVENREGNPIIWITSYALMRDDRVIRSINWNRVILEEGHIIRNSKSCTSKVAMCLKSDIKLVITGTPIQNSIQDLITLFRFIGVEDKYVKEEPERCLDKFMLRRTKKEIKKFNSVLNLPPMIEKVIRLPFKTKQEEKFYNSIKKDVQKELMSSLYNFNNVKIIELLLRLRQASILPQLVIDSYSKKWKKRFTPWRYSNTKLDFIVDNVIKEKERAIIFTNFKGETEYLMNSLKKASLRISSIQGCVSLSNRQKILERCQKIVDPEDDQFIDILLVQINAGGTGLNLQKFNVVYFTSPNWNPSLEAQAIARSHRIGQDKPVKVYKAMLESENFETIEKYIFGKQQLKNDIILKFIGE